MWSHTFRVPPGTTVTPATRSAPKGRGELRDQPRRRSRQSTAIRGTSSGTSSGACRGEGRALREAARALPGDAVLTGVDLVGPLGPRPTPPTVTEIVASVSSWTPTRTYDLITCVHGLHYIGDQLGLLARAASWLAPDGLFAAHFDPESIRWADGSAAGRAAVSALRSAGFRYSARHHRLTLEGAREPSLPFRYLGADPAAGPNYTGQPAVGSHYGHP
ncbi:class I SAM-dependent methyltransferase [Streptomyces sp. NPDC054940]